MYFYYGELEWSEITIYSNDVLERIKLLKLNIINKKEMMAFLCKVFTCRSKKSQDPKVN